MDPATVTILLLIIGGLYKWFNPSPERKAELDAAAAQRIEEKRIARERKLAAKAQAQAEKERIRRKQNRHCIVANLERERDAKLQLCRTVEDIDLRDSMEALAKREYAVQLAQLLKE